MWHLKYGQKRDWFEEIEETEGKQFDFLDEKPELYPDLYNDWKAFWMLSGSRQIGMGLGNIQISEIYAYMKMLEITDISERELLLTRIQILDRTYLNYQNDVREKKKSPKRKK